MPGSVQCKLVFALLLGLAPGFLVAQTPDYYQTTSATIGSPQQRAAVVHGVTLVVERISPTFRVPVQTTPEQPVVWVQVRGHRDMYCAAMQVLTPKSKTEAGSEKAADSGGELNFREALYRKLALLDVGAMQVALQRGEKAADRAAQYRELFGVALPPLTGEWDYLQQVDTGLDESVQMQLNLGQETTVATGSVCATPAQVDAAIAEARRVYAAVIAAMQGGGAKSGLTTGAKPSLQTQNPGGK
jgi:hypothetical protein